METIAAIASWSPHYAETKHVKTCLVIFSEDSCWVFDDLRLVGRNWCKGMFFL